MSKLEDRIRESIGDDYQVNDFVPSYIQPNGRVVYQGYIVDKFPPNNQQLYIEFSEMPETKRLNDKIINNYKK